MTTPYQTRTIPSTAYEIPLRTGVYTFYTWWDTPDSWLDANQTWGNYWFWIANTAYDPRTIPSTTYSVRTPI